MCDLPGQQCKKLPQRGVAYWDSADLFEGGMPVYLTSSGYQYSTAPVSTKCGATPHISKIEPAIGVAEGGTAVTVHGTGFGEPMRCRFGHLETQAYNITAHSVSSHNRLLADYFARPATISQSTSHALGRRCAQVQP